MFKAVNPVRQVERKNGVRFYDFGKSAFSNLQLKLTWSPKSANEQQMLLEIDIGEKAVGLVPEKNQTSVIDFIKSKGMACGVYSSNYLLEALFNYGQSDYAMSLLPSDSDRSWLKELAPEILHLK